MRSSSYIYRMQDPMLKNHILFDITLEVEMVFYSWNLLNSCIVVASDATFSSDNYAMKIVTASCTCIERERER
jgi:hypothetical protein